MAFDAFNAFTVDAAPGYTAHIGTRNSSLNIREYVAISIECIVEQGIKLLNTTYRISNTIMIIIMLFFLFLISAVVFFIYVFALKK